MTKTHFAPAHCGNLGPRPAAPSSFARVAGIFAALLFASGLPSAYAQNLYIAGGGGQFGKLNVTTGVYTSIATQTTYNGNLIDFTGLARTNTGNLYGLEFSTGSTPRLFQINTTTGGLSLVAAVSGFSPTGTNAGSAIGTTSDGTVYAYHSPNFNSVAATLYTLNTTTAAATSVGNTTVTLGGGINGDASGNLFAAGGGAGNDAIDKLNRTSGAATTLNASPGTGNVYGLGYTNNALYALNTTGGIFTVDTTTGVVTNTGVTYNTSLTGGIYAVAPVPEPGSFALCIITLIPAARHIRRKMDSLTGSRS